MLIEISSDSNCIYYSSLPGSHLKKVIELIINISLEKNKTINLEFNGYNHNIVSLSINDHKSYADFLYKNWFSDKVEREFYSFKSLLRNNKINIILESPSE